MDVQKVLAQIEQLLKRGKTQEAVEKLEDVLEADPQNEVAANKLAVAYISLEQKSKAVGLYCDVARRASAKGKNQKAFAMYKQALSIDDSDPRVLKGIAEESEQLGKFSDAVKYSELLVNYYLPRKRYLDIIDACARLVRCQPENERAKQIWLEVVRILADESKLARALVVFCGPPGLASEEEKIGGDPSKIGQAILSQLIALLEWFPTDPSLPYALAWVAYRNNNRKTAYRFLAEAFERDPDYCLCPILFARILVDDERLAEAQFAFEYAKESIARDHRTNIKVLTEQIANFEKANGWMAFSEGLGDGKLSAENFLRKVRGEELVGTKPDDKAKAAMSPPPVAAPDREIRLTPAPEGAVNEDGDEAFEATSMVRVTPVEAAGLELELSPSESRIGETAKPAPPAPPPLPSAPRPPLPVAPSNTLVDPEDHVEGTRHRLTRMNDQLLSDVISPADAAATAPAESQSLNLEKEEKTRTEIYSPQDMVNAGKWERAAQVEIDRQTIQVARQEREAIAAQKEKNTRMLLEQEAQKRKEAEKKSGAVSALMEMAGLRRPKLNAEDTGSFPAPPPFVPEQEDAATVIFKPDPPPPLSLEPAANVPEGATGIALDSKVLAAAVDEDNEPTVIGRFPVASSETAASHPAPSRPTFGFEKADPDDQPSQLQPFKLETREIRKQIEQQATEMLVSNKSVASEGIVKIPDSPQPAAQQPQSTAEPAAPTIEEMFGAPHAPEVVAPKAAVPEPTKTEALPPVDSGTDLLVKEKPAPERELEMTRLFQERLANQKRREASDLLNVSDEYLTKGNYYLARKACREALALGADRETVNARLRAIRDKEFPESFYRQYSTDSPESVTSVKIDEIIRGLERDYDISFGDDLPDFEMRMSAKNLRPTIEAQLQGCDAKLRIDLGVAFFEMGFYEEAENQFLNATTDERARFEATYLAAQAMAARGNHRSAIDALDKLVRIGGRSEQEFLPVYYLLGEAYAALEDNGESKKYFQKVAEIDRNYRSVKDKINRE